jgi:hypothetical protein
MRDLQAAEHVRYLTERLVRANRIERVEPELVDSLLNALRPLLSGNDPARAPLTTAAMEAIELQNGIMRAVLDDQHCRVVALYLALPAPEPALRGGAGPGSGRRCEMVSERGKAPADRVAPPHAKTKQA